MSSKSAFLIHMALSTVVLGVMFALILFVWYPHPYFKIVDAWYLIRILFFVAIFIGPFLTLIIFKPGKWGLKFDLWFIAIVQVASLAYGAVTIYQQRPYFLVFSVDRFEVIPAKNLDMSQLQYDVLKEKPWIGTVPVFAQLPEDPEEASRFRDEVFYAGKRDLEGRPEYWHPYADYALDAASKARNIEQLLGEGEKIAELATQVIERHQGSHTQLGFVPLIGRTSSFSMILDMQTGEQLQILDIDPYKLSVDKQARTDP